MKKTIPLTGTTTSASISSPEHQRFIKSLNRAMEKILASGKIKILNDGAFVRRDQSSIGPISSKTAAAIGEFKRELNSISAPPESAPAPAKTAPPRPAFIRPTD